MDVVEHQIRTRGFDVAPCWRVRVLARSASQGARDEILYTVAGTSILDPNETVKKSGLVNWQAPTAIVLDACEVNEPGLLFYAPEFPANQRWQLWLAVHFQNEECA